MTDFYPMLSVEEALQRVLSHFHVLEAEPVLILEALGRVLAEDVRAEADIPPHANTAMDGYALQAADTLGASVEKPRRLRVIADLAAGYVAERQVTPGTAIRIMTGAPIPAGADAVVRFEDTQVDGEWVSIQVEAPPGENVRAAGEDVLKGAVVLQRGTRLRPQEIGMLAGVGRARVHVTRRPRIGILATGDEVVEPPDGGTMNLGVDAPLGPGKIRNSNSYSNAAQVLRAGGTPVMMGIARDDVQELTAKIRAGLAQVVDLFITSGGVSVGDFDVVKKVLAAEGEITFWRVRMKPGKPLAFGRIQGVPMLGLPGNPVSAMVSFELFARPAILYMQGLANLGRPTVEARLMDEVRRKDDRRHYLRVRVEQRGSEYLAYLTGEQGSGILSSMVEADGLAILPEEWSSAKQGSRVQVWMLDWERGPHMQAAAPLRGNYEPRKGSAMILSLGILTISDRCSRGEAEDASGPAIRRIAMERLGAEVKVEACVPDEVNRISSLLVEWCDTRQLDLILTTGGTGFSPRDVTPEAMLAVIERQAPGLGEAMRREGAKATPHAMLSRATAGIRGKTLIVNLPGSVKAVTEGLEVILPALPHAIEILTGAQGANQRHEFKH